MWGGYLAGSEELRGFAVQKLAEHAS